MSVKSKACTSHKADHLEAIFARVFYANYQTVLTGGANEPLYTPADQTNTDSTIYYREDFFASALHEVSHWCIAGDKRRQQIDFGYWYVDDGRDDIEQLAFEAAEVKPQAIECLFSLAANYSFQVSADNLNGSTPAIEGFKQAVFDQAKHYCNNGLPKRAAVFYQALSEHFSGLSITDLSSHFDALNN